MGPYFLDILQYIDGNISQYSHNSSRFDFRDLQEALGDGAPVPRRRSPVRQVGLRVLGRRIAFTGVDIVHLNHLSPPQHLCFFLGGGRRFFIFPLYFHFSPGPIRRFRKTEYMYSVHIFLPSSKILSLSQFVYGMNYAMQKWQKKV